MIIQRILRTAMSSPAGLKPLFFTLATGSNAIIRRAFGTRAVRTPSTQVAACYDAWEKAVAPTKRRAPLEQAKFIRAVYARFPLHDPYLVFPGVASFVVTNIIDQFAGLHDIGVKKFGGLAQGYLEGKIAYVLDGTKAVADEIVPPLLALSTAGDHRLPVTDVFKALIERQVEMREPLKAGLALASSAQSGKSAAVAMLTNEQINTLQPLLYDKLTDRIMYLGLRFYSAVKADFPVQQRLVMAANPSGAVSRDMILDGSGLDLSKPEVRIAFGTRAIDWYIDALEKNPAYVYKQLSVMASAGPLVDLEAWKQLEAAFGATALTAEQFVDVAAQKVDTLKTEIADLELGTGAHGLWHRRGSTIELTLE